MNNPAVGQRSEPGEERGRQFFIDPRGEIGGLRAELARQAEEVKRLREELASVQAQKQELEDSRRAMLFMLEDLNESERSLEESERRFKRLVESVTDYIYTVKVVNGDPVETIHGPGCVTVTGYRPDEYDADPFLWFRMIHAEDRQAVLDQSEKLLHQAVVRPIEHRIIHKNGSTRWVRNTPVPRYDEHGVLVTYDGLISDITERRKLEAQLRQAQKMEAIGQLAGGIAHDFNNILSAIVGYGHVLHMKMKADEPLKLNVEHMLEAAERAAHLTRSLLAFSRKQVLNPVDADFTEIIRRTEKFLRRVIGEDIELRTVFRQETATVHADSGQIEQVLMNLATNARDAMPHGGSLTLELDTYRLDEVFVREHGYGQEGWYARLSVTDTGTGMDKETQRKIFDPFFTTKEVGKGTGLGLAIVYGIIKQHDGYVNVNSEPGRGATFNIYLPLARAKAEKNQSAALSGGQELLRGSETILVAEDDEALRMLYTSVLSEFGYTVIEAADGESAVARFSGYPGDIHLLVTDLIMPRKNGREVYQELRKVRPGVKALFISGYTADKILAEGLLDKGVELIMKPISPRDLLKKVRTALDKPDAGRQGRAA